MAENALPAYRSISIDGWKGAVSMAWCEESNAESMDSWHSWLSKLVRNPDSLPGRKVLKTSKTVEVFEAEFAFEGSLARRVVCKQRVASARKNFQRALTLHRAGIETAKPLAWLQNRKSSSSWFITEYLENVVDLDSFVVSTVPRLSSSVRRMQSNAIIESLARTFRKFERAGLYHRDMKASNFLLSKCDVQNSTPQVFIVDLDGLTVMRPWRSHWKPIVRLAASLLQYPAVTRTDLARFLGNYLIAGGDDQEAWRVHFNRLSTQAIRYAQAARSRKLEKLDGYAG